MTNNKKVLSWLDEMVKLTKPDEVIWIDGSDAQKEALEKEACATGEIKALNPDKFPGCFLHRTAQNDVARVENKTFICSRRKEDAGPTNNWMDPKETYEKLSKLYDGAMTGKKMYVIPFIMGPAKSPFAKVGIELTDSIYVVLNMLIMTRAGKIALEEIGDEGDFTKCLHASKDLSDEDKYICHFPEDNTIWSINSAYGGNALLGKKCMALRIASYLGKEEGWMAEHMLILGLQDPKGEITYVSAAFPSACGKTNLAMLIPPKEYAGYKVFTVGDDIAWLRVGDDGRLWAVNPEAGFFGVAPGTSEKTNPNALHTAMSNTIFTNVGLKDDDTIWWEGLDKDVPAHAIDWKGEEWTPDKYNKEDKLTSCAHPNSRFTAPARQCPCVSDQFDAPQGVPISAMVFGGRRATTAPLVYQTYSWNHGVFVGATMASETTAAARGAVGVLRRDPMAMKPFIGYHVGDYLAHWVKMGKTIPNPPKIFHVNWFRQDENGNFMWPGFGENMRVLEWIVKRCKGEVDARETAIGYLPNVEDINVNGLDIEKSTMERLLKVEETWKEEVPGMREFFSTFEGRLPKEVEDELDALEARLNK